MAKSFFVYDLETSGLHPRDDRIMQFAGIRVDENFEQLGEPYDILIELSEDTLPSPSALMVTGITPQQTRDAGYSEADFAKLFVEEICTPETTILGFNSVRFDDEFIRALLWRNFYDPYEWSYRDGRSRWDLLDVVRMTRALRPDGITWPVDDEGRSTNRLELLTQANGISHESAHDALSDVRALVDVMKLVRSAQPKLFDYLYDMRTKDALKHLINLDTKTPFVYSSGRYETKYEKTSVAMAIGPADNGNIVVYDLRYDPSAWEESSINELRTVMTTPYAEQGEDYQAIPVKVLQYNRCPAVAPLGVLGQDSAWSRIGLEETTISAHRSYLLGHPELMKRLSEALTTSKPTFTPAPDAEGRLYDGFISDLDKMRAEKVRTASRRDIKSLNPEFGDARLAAMYPNYVMRNFSQSASDDQCQAFEVYRNERLIRQSPKFIRDFEQVLKRSNLSTHQEFVLEELKLWYESVMPSSG